MTSPGSTDRTRVRRVPGKAVTDTVGLHAVLDAGLVAHVAVVDDGMAFVLPVAYARRGDEVLFHGSTGSRLFRLLAAGQPTCLSLIQRASIPRSPAWDSTSPSPPCRQPSRP